MVLIYCYIFNDFHIRMKNEAATRATGSLSLVGINSDEILPKRKTEIFICMVRSILFFSADCMVYNQNEQRNFARTESLILKESIGLSKYCYNTELMHGLNIMNTYSQLECTKLLF